jgi:hypothetical protein
LILALLALTLFVPVAAADTAAQQDSTRLGGGKRFSSPFWVMMRSAAVPGWGQLHNGKWWKAVLIGGTETAFIYGIFREDYLADRAAEKARSEPDPSLAAQWRGISSSHKSNKRDYLWWGAFTVLLSIGDAYVDAHLKGFDVEFREEDSAVLLSFGVSP